MPKQFDLNKVTDRWAGNGAGAASKYADSVNACNIDVMGKCADSEQQYLAGIQRASASGIRARKLREYGTARWKQRTATIGSQNLGSGMANAKDKYKAAMGVWLPITMAIADSLPPRGDLNMNIARADMQMRKMAQAKLTGGSY